MNHENTRADGVIYFDAEQSAELFAEADVKSHFWTICRYFISEKFMTYCGIAGSVTILNSLGVESPDSPQIYPYKMFTQDNIFTDDVLQSRRPVDVEKGGNTLEQLAGILGAFDVRVDTYYAGSLDCGRCRELLIGALQTPKQRVIVDFDRQTLMQKGSGHFSPLAAYHSGQDRFLLMDVARYKLPPCWVKAEMLFKAMSGQDPASNKSRGFLLVTRRDAAGGRLA